MKIKSDFCCFHRACDINHHLDNECTNDMIDFFLPNPKLDLI